MRALQTTQAPTPTSASATVRAIEPPATKLPEEPASAGRNRFSFVAYGDTRSASDPNVPGDGRVVQAEHSHLVDRLIAKSRELASTPFPIRFVLQSGDAVLREWSDLLKSKFRGSDIVCRYGGEEFVIILPEITLDSAHQRLELADHHAFDRRM